MKNPLIEMKEALEQIVGPISLGLHPMTPKEMMAFRRHYDVDEAKSALSALESSGWNLEAIEDCVTALEKCHEELVGYCLHQGGELHVALKYADKALTKLKGKK
jgi:hypothetical protein